LLSFQSKKGKMGKTGEFGWVNEKFRTKIAL